MKHLSMFLLILSPLFYSAHAKDPSSDGKQYISWQDVAKDSKDLAQKLKDQGPFEGIVAVARGGYIPAVIIAHELNIKKSFPFPSTVMMTNKRNKEGLTFIQNLKTLKNAGL